MQCPHRRLTVSANRVVGECHAQFILDNKLSKTVSMSTKQKNQNPKPPHLKKNGPAMILSSRYQFNVYGARLSTSHVRFTLDIRYAVVVGCMYTRGAPSDSALTAVME